MSDGLAARIVAYAAQDSGAPGPDVLDLVARSLADTYGVAVGGGGEPAAQAALRYLADTAALAGQPRAGSASLWGTGERAAPEVAAWWNGLAAHVLDYDDVTVPLRGHPSVVLWPAIMALAEARDIAGERAACAFVVGMEVLCKLARGFAMEQYAAGWHTTASIGALASAVACAHLLRLTPDQTLNAIGLAVAQAAGSRENVGTDAKSFQAGHACAAGVRAAALAQQDFGAGPDALEGANGYLQLYAGGLDAGGLMAGLGEMPLEIQRAGIDVKQYPMCYATHRALDAVLALRHEHGLRMADVRQVAVTTSRAALTPLVHPTPSTGLQGKFSMQYAMAAALLDGHVRLASFTDEAVLRPEAQAFFERVAISEADGAANPRWAEVALDLLDGRRLVRRVEVLNGSHQNPLGASQLSAKIDDCLRWAGKSGDGAAVLAACRELPGHRGRAFMSALARIVQSNHV